MTNGLKFQLDAGFLEIYIAKVNVKARSLWNKNLLGTTWVPGPCCQSSAWIAMPM